MARRKLTEVMHFNTMFGNDTNVAPQCCPTCHGPIKTLRVFGVSTYTCQHCEQTRKREFISALIPNARPGMPFQGKVN